MRLLKLKAGQRAGILWLYGASDKVPCVRTIKSLVGKGVAGPGPDGKFVLTDRGVRVAEAILRRKAQTVDANLLFNERKFDPVQFIDKLLSGE